MLPCSDLVGRSLRKLICIRLARDWMWKVSHRKKSAPRKENRCLSMCGFSSLGWTIKRIRLLWIRNTLLIIHKLKIYVSPKEKDQYMERVGIVCWYFSTRHHILRRNSVFTVVFLNEIRIKRVRAPPRKSLFDGIDPSISPFSDFIPGTCVSLFDDIYMYIYLPFAMFLSHRAADNIARRMKIWFAYTRVHNRSRRAGSVYKILHRLAEF